MLFGKKTLIDKLKSNIVKYLPLYEQYIKPGNKVLDIGSGSGIHAALLTREIQNIKLQCLDVGYYLWPENKGLRHVVYDGNKIPFKGKEFDVCLLFFVLHHAKEMRLLVSEAARVANKYVIVFEEVYSNNFNRFVMVAYDLVVNFIIFRQLITLPTFTTDRGLNKLFKEEKLKIVSKIKIEKEWYYPPQRILYVLEK